MITRTAATVDAIPASHSIGIEARKRVGGPVELEYIIKKGDRLPKIGKTTFKAAESLRSGSPNSLNFIIREGDIEHPISDNSFIGVFKVTGRDFTDGVIPAGADLICEYEILDSGNVKLEVTIPSIGASLRRSNFYSRKEAEVDFTNAAKRILEDAAKTEAQLSELERQIDEPSVAAARKKLTKANTLSPGKSDPEAAKEAMDGVQKAKELLAKARKANFKLMRRIELNRLIANFEDIRCYATPAEESSFEALLRTAERTISDPNGDFELHARSLSSKLFMILFRQDWFIIDRFKWFADSPHLFGDKKIHERLVADGQNALTSGDTNQLRQVVCDMEGQRFESLRPMIYCPHQTS